MRLFGYPYNDLVRCKDSPDYLKTSMASMLTKVEADMTGENRGIKLRSNFWFCDTGRIFNSLESTVDSPPFFRPDYGRPESTQ